MVLKYKPISSNSRTWRRGEPRAAFFNYLLLGFFLNPCSLYEHHFPENMFVCGAGSGRTLNVIWMIAQYWVEALLYSSHRRTEGVDPSAISIMASCRCFLKNAKWRVCPKMNDVINIFSSPIRSLDSTIFYFCSLACHLGIPAKQRRTPPLAALLVAPSLLHQAEHTVSRDQGN